MKLRLILSFAVPLAAALYLLFYNRVSIHIRLSNDLAFDLPVVVVVLVSALLGAFLSGLLGWGEAGVHAFGRWGERRKGRRRERAREYLARAERLRGEGKLRPARRAARRAIRLDSSLGPAHVFAGHLAEEAGDYSEAIRFHTLAQELSIDSVVATVRLTSALEASGRVEEAIQMLAQAADKERGHPAILRRWRDLCVRCWRWEEALVVVRKLNQLDATPAERKEDEETALQVLIQTAEKRLSTPNGEGASSLLDEASRKLPDSAEARLRLGDAYLAEGKPRRAVKAWEAGYRELGAAEFLRRQIAFLRTAEKNGGSRKVVAAIASAARTRPADPLPPVMAAAVFLEEGKQDEAMEWLKKASDALAASDPGPEWTGIVHRLLEARGKLEAGDRLAAESAFREVAQAAGRKLLGERGDGVVLRPVEAAPVAES